MSYACSCVLTTRRNFYVINIESDGIIESIDITVKCVFIYQTNVKERVIAMHLHN